MILLIDHRDSFTQNLRHLLENFDQVKVCDRHEISAYPLEKVNFIVLSPGPGKPSDYPETTNFINLTKGKIPILGICLGFQLLMASDGARIIRQTQVLHGVGTEISTTMVSKTYHGLSPSIWVARYHSLQVDPESLPNLPSSVKITSYDPVHKVPLSFEDLERSLFGLQYHPESFLTTAGKTLIANIRNACME